MKLECSYVQLPKIYKHLSGNELKVFVTMFDQWSMMKNEDGWYYRSQKQLCEDTGLTDRTLRDIIKKFVEKGVIFTTTYNDGVKMATYNKANEYKINMKKVVEMSKEKVVKKVKEGGNFYHPSKNIITKEKNKKYNINNKTSEDITPDVETLQDKKVNNDLKLNNMKKENEMSDNGTNAMNAISEQSERQARENESSESGKENEMTTSTSGYKNKTSKEFQNIPVDKSKVINEKNDTPKGLTPHPQIALTPLSPSAWDEDAIFGLEEPQNVSGDKLSTNEVKTCQNAQECPQIEFNREEMLQLMDMSANETDLDRFKGQLRKMDEYMQWLKLNDSFQYKLYVKEIYCWFKSHTWNMELDFISLGGEFMRKYVA